MPPYLIRRYNGLNKNSKNNRNWAMRRTVGINLCPRCIVAWMNGKEVCMRNWKKRNGQTKEQQINAETHTHTYIEWMRRNGMARKEAQLRTEHTYNFREGREWFFSCSPSLFGIVCSRQICVNEAEQNIKFMTLSLAAKNKSSLFLCTHRW